MSIENIESKLKTIICDYVDVTPDQIKSDMSFSYDMGIDSFGLISMVCSIEEAFNVQIPDNELAEFRTLGDMSRYIQANAA